MSFDSDIQDRLTSLADRAVLPTVDAAGLLSSHRTYRRRRLATAATGVTLVLVGAVGAAVSSGGQTESVHQFGDGSQGTGFAPDNGRDWLIDTPTPRHSDGTFYDPEDEDNIPTASQSPYPEAPYAELSAALLDEVRGAGLPAGTQMEATRDEFALASVRITLPDGTPMIVMRGRYTHAIRFRMSSTDGVGAQIQVADISGTSSAALLDPAFGFTFPRPFSAGPTSNRVTVVTREGVTTTWVAPPRVRMNRMQAWAFEAARSR